ncbi:MAG: haloacid dehalogenase-like hydrolase [Planctomycetota bacterium]
MPRGVTQRSDMILGLDFDNTIARYDELFFKLARERDLIPADLPHDKTAIRDFLRQRGHEDNWTKLQGIAYGPRITEAQPFTGVTETIARLVLAGIETHIVSHKTKTPYRGKPHDLHAAARNFLNHHGISPQHIPAERVHLCPTKDAKLERIGTLGCTHFLDDLPEFLAEPAFPTSTQRLLFDPAQKHMIRPRVQRICRWTDLLACTPTSP